MDAGVQVRRDAKGCTYYVVAEIVTEAGHYIVWPGIYATIDSAYAAIRAAESAEGR